MPIPTAGLLKRPLTMLIFFFSGSSGASDLLNFSSVPAPLAHQWFPLMPLPMNSTAKRLGNGPAARSAATGLPQAGSDSSHGSAMLTPTPRNTVRLDMPLIAFTSLLSRCDRAHGIERRDR